MCRQILILVIALAVLLQVGCAADFRAGGPNRGVEAGASIGRPPVYVGP
jgi:hypothetical protein